MDELRNRMKKTKERINKLEDRKIEIIQSEQMRNRLKKKNKQILRDLWGYNTRFKIHVIRLPEGKDRGGGLKKL